MLREPVESSMIASVGYDSAGEMLEIEFTQGAVYLYAGVPPHVYSNMMDADSIGRYFIGVIKETYPCRQL